MRLGRVVKERLMSWFQHHIPKHEPAPPAAPPVPSGDGACPSVTDSPEYQEVRARQHAARNMVQDAENIIEENTSEEVRDAVLHSAMESNYRAVCDRHQNRERSA